MKPKFDINKRFLVVSNHYVTIYDNKKSEDYEKQFKVKLVEAVYIDEKRDKVILKLKKLPNIMIKSKRAQKLFRIILSINIDENVLAFSIPDKEFKSYVCNDSLPDDEYLVNDDTNEHSNDVAKESSHILLVKKTNAKVGINLLNCSIKIQPKVCEERKSGTEDERSTCEDDDLNRKTYSSEGENFFKRTKSLLTCVRLEDFKLIKELGRGGFGTVILAKDEDKQLYAMKRIRKDILLKLDAVNGFIVERNILSKQKHPFLLSLKHAFESELRYYLFCEYIPGGDIYGHLLKQKDGFNLDTIRFFGCQIILALEHLHKNGYIHCDLKPENILIDSEGYIKLADFGISRHIDKQKKQDHAFGTYEYMAPEIVEATRYNRKFQVDWWAFGILLFELRFKKSPFKADSISEIKRKILKDEVKFPPMNNDPDEKHFKKLIRELLTKDPRDRLGYSEDGTGADQLKDHKFFSDKYDFDQMLKRKYDSPYNPKVDTKQIKKYEKARGLSIGATKNLDTDTGSLGETTLDPKAARKIKHRFNKEFRKCQKE